MLTIDHTCIKKGNYNITPEEKPSTVNPEIDTPDPEYPVEIDYPDYDQDYGLASVDSEIDIVNSDPYEDDLIFDDDLREDWQEYDPEPEDYEFEEDGESWNPCIERDYENSLNLDFDSIVREVKVDIKENKFLEKCVHYMELLKVNRLELEEFITYPISRFLIEDKFKYQVNEVKVFERLFELYCPKEAFVIPPQTNHHLREYLDRLDANGNLVVKNQLNLFGEV